MISATFSGDGYSDGPFELCGYASWSALCGRARNGTALGQLCDAGLLAGTDRLSDELAVMTGEPKGAIARLTGLVGVGDTGETITLSGVSTDDPTVGEAVADDE